MLNSLSTVPERPELVLYLFARREAILANWRTVCEQDPTLHTVSSLSREEFNDMVPTLLNVLSQRLQSEPEEVDPMQAASEHGLHRWHKGYSLHELLKEAGYLNQILINELRTYEALYPTTQPAELIRVYQEIARLTNEIVEGSAARYHDLDRASALGRADTLQAALDEINELTRQRTDVLRTSSHDLRSSFGIIQGAASMLNLEHQSEEERSRLMDMLNRNLTNVQTMLQNLMSLARLDAGQDPTEIGRFNVAQVLHELAQSAQPLAAERGLTLLSDGPEQLEIESDSVKIRRIVQNLLLNALMYTPSGIVSVSWQRENDYRWLVSVQDTGPGLPAEVVQTLSAHLAPVQESASVFEGKPLQSVSDEDAAPQPTGERSQGEGIGLHIVKRLCEVLDASIDVETRPAGGTLVRVRFPIHYKP